MKRSRMLVIGMMLVVVAGLVGARGPLVKKDSVLVLDLGGDIQETAP